MQCEDVLLSILVYICSNRFQSSCRRNVHAFMLVYYHYEFVRLSRSFRNFSIRYVVFDTSLISTFHVLRKLLCRRMFAPQPTLLLTKSSNHKEIPQWCRPHLHMASVAKVVPSGLHLVSSMTRCHRAVRRHWSSNQLG